MLGVDMLRTLDGGINWFEATPPWWTYEVHADKHDLVFAHGNMYLGTDGGAYMTDIDQLNSWADISKTFLPHNFTAPPSIRMPPGFTMAVLRIMVRAEEMLHPSMGTHPWWRWIPAFV